MGNDPSRELENSIFELKFSAKQLQRGSKTAKKNAAAERKKVLKAMQEGNEDIAKIHAQNCTRQNQQALNFLRLASRMEAVAARVQAAQNMNMIGFNIKRVNRVIGMSLKSMNLEQSFSTMETFDKQCEELDTQLAVMEESMSLTVASEQPEDQVHNLMREVADEAGLSLSDDLQVEPQKKVEEVQPEQVDEEARALEDRFKNL